MGAVGRAMSMIKKFADNFTIFLLLRELPEIMNQNEEKPPKSGLRRRNHLIKPLIRRSTKCVEISTQSAIKEMVLPGMVAILTPVAVGLGGNYFFPGSGAVMLGGYLQELPPGVLMALFQSNAGGAWDNAKKMVEEGYGSTAQFTATQKYIRRQLSGTPLAIR